MLGLWNGTPGARRWRQVWSNHRLKDQPPAHVARLADAARCRDIHDTEPLDA
jgi:tRNA-dihydrouridine synthase A